MTKHILVEVKERNIEVYDGFKNEDEAKALMKELMYKQLEEIGFSKEDLEDADPTEFGIDEDSAFSSLGGVNLDYQIVDITV